MNNIEQIGNLVLKRVQNSVGYIVLNRPEYLNALNLGLARQFLAAMEQFSKDGNVRAIVIRGEGKVFSAGGDIKEMWSDVCSGSNRAAYFGVPLTAFNQMVLSIQAAAKPVLAAVHGAVAGAAFNLMLSCDLRIAQEGTRFSQSFIKIGLSPDAGGTYFLPRLVGYARACELTLLSEEINAQKALSWGLINWVVPTDTFDDEVTKIAERLAQGPVPAMARTKALLNQTYDRSLAEQMEAERLFQVENAAGKDFGEGLKAFIEKRPPKFY